MKVGRRRGVRLGAVVGGEMEGGRDGVFWWFEGGPMEERKIWSPGSGSDGGLPAKWRGKVKKGGGWWSIGVAAILSRRGN